MPAHHPPDVMIRPAAQDDRGFVRQLAPRLLVGYAAWRDASLMLHTMERFLLESFEAPPDRGMMFIAERSDGARLGAVSVAHNVNFTGEPQAYMGELAVVEEAEGEGIGRLLVARAEEWARDNGYHLLVLDTGAANSRARGFYARLGYREESVRLVKLLS